MAVALSRFEIEQSDLPGLMAELDGCLAMAKMAVAKQNAATATVERLQGGLTDLLKMHKAAGGADGDEPPQADNFRQRIAEARSDLRRTVEEQQRHEGFASTLRLELGVCESLWAKFGGDAAATMVAVAELVSEAIDSAPADRDAAQAAHEKSEARPKQKDGESDFAFREKAEAWELRIASGAAMVAPAAHYSAVLAAIREKHGLRIARLTQTRMWSDGLLPAGEGYL